MSSRIIVNLLSVLIACLLLSPAISNAGADFATFESFYRQSIDGMWIFAVAVVLAIIGGAFIFYTGGAASPAVASVGTWLGGMMGLSGAAATNAGLALLGGGSIVSGGFGIIGGTALLTATFTFSTSVVIDYAAGKAVGAYDYAQFAKNSKQMTTLPVPRNSSGPEAYEAAIAVLERVNSKESISTTQNQIIIKQAINKLVLPSKENLSTSDYSRNQSLLALLYFITNDYNKAENYAKKGFLSAQKAKSIGSLPAFIYGTAMLYEAKPNLDTSIKHLNYAVNNEPDNPIYLDRMIYRINDGYLASNELDKIYSLSEKLPYDERKAIIQTGIISRYFIIIKLQQQKILSLSRSNKTIKDNPKTLEHLKKSLQEYKHLVKFLKILMDERSKRLNVRSNQNLYIVDILKGKKIAEWESQWLKQINKMKPLWLDYSKGTPVLETKVKALALYQAELKRMSLEKKNVKKPMDHELLTVTKNEDWTWWRHLTIISILLLLGYFLFRGLKIRSKEKSLSKV
jgi:tetratricopeptide (TPR) repeat protein